MNNLEIIGSAAKRDTMNTSEPCTTKDFCLDQETASLLKTGLRSGSQKAYKEALLLEKYRDTLLEQANELRSEIQQDIVQKAKKLAPRIFGWNNTEIAGFNCNLDRRPVEINGDYENIWETLVGLESHDFRLEDPKVSAEFFSEMQRNFLKQDLKHVDPKFMSKYPWLKTAEMDPSISTNIPTKKMKKSSPLSSLFTPKKCTSQQRLEKELAEQEAELQQRLATKFRAKTIPESSITPKYDKIMENQGTRSTRIRVSVLKVKIEKKETADALEMELISKKQIKKPSKTHAYSPPIIRHKLDSEERRKVVLKETMKECTFKPNVKSKIPDFEREHQKFKEILEKSKSQRSTTIPQPFHLSTRPASRPKKASVDEREISSPTKAKKIFDTEPIIFAKSTKTAELKIQHRQDEKDAQDLIEQYQRELREVAESKRMAIAERLRVRLESSSKLAKERLIKEKVKHKLVGTYLRNADQEQSEKSYLERMGQMEERLDSRKCLFERVVLDAARNRSNKQIKEVLASAGLEMALIS